MAFQFDFTALKHPLVVEALTLKLNDVLHGYAKAVPGGFALVESLDVGSEVRACVRVYVSGGSATLSSHLPSMALTLISVLDSHLIVAGQLTPLSCLCSSSCSVLDQQTPQVPVLSLVQCEVEGAVDRARLSIFLSYAGSASVKIKAFAQANTLVSRNGTCRHILSISFVGSFH